MKKIKLIGFDMDYTLVRYNIAEFENLSHTYAAQLLVKEKGYPSAVGQLQFDPNRAIVGLVIDQITGNLIKLNRYSKVKAAYHGLKEVDFRTVKTTYQNMAVELRDPEWMPLDTSFAISTGVLFSQVVQLKEDGLALPDYRTIARDVGAAIDSVHKNGSIKKVILADLDRFVIQDPKVAWMLERYKDYGKQLMMITNSDWAYTKALLEHAITPHLRNHKNWIDIFDTVITLADKPRFFEQASRFLEINPQTGLMQNYEGSVAKGLYQGGWFRKLQSDFGLQGSEILYIGDHIYGDVVSIKRHCDWRTALVLGDLEQEMEGIQKAQGVQRELDELMVKKMANEEILNQMDLDRYEGRSVDRTRLDTLFEESDNLNGAISDCIVRYRTFFNPYWGEILRAGQEESRYADQIDKYACIYMTRASDLYIHSPKSYFRPPRRVMPHEALRPQ